MAGSHPTWIGDFATSRETKIIQLLEKQDNVKQKFLPISAKNDLFYKKENISLPIIV
jgi:hypothetical protein